MFPFSKMLVLISGQFIFCIIILNDKYFYGSPLQYNTNDNELTSSWALSEVFIFRKKTLHSSWFTLGSSHYL